MVRGNGFTMHDRPRWMGPENKWVMFGSAAWPKPPVSQYQVPPSFRNFSVTEGMKSARNVTSNLFKKPGVFHRSVNEFMKSGFGKYVLGANVNPFMIAAGWAVAATAFGVTKQFSKSVSMRKVEQPSTIGYGAGFISWSKTSGMPANHLSTDGLSLSLSNLRHSSVI